MTKLLVGLLAIAAVGFLALKGVGALESKAQAPQEPTRQLQNVRDAAKRIEADDARRAEEALEKSKPD